MKNLTIIIIGTKQVNNQNNQRKKVKFTNYD